MARKLTQNDVKKILLNIVSDCNDCLRCDACKSKKLESIVKDLEDIKEDNGLNYIGSDFIDNKLPLLQKALCTANSIQRDKMIKECIKSISSDNKNNKRPNSIATKKDTKKSFLKKLFG